MATDSGYRRFDPLRVCDVCGDRYHFSDLTPIGEMRWACKDDAPGLTATQISRYNGRARPLKVKSVKHARGLSQVPTYAAAEASIFNFLATVAPATLVAGGPPSTLTASWTAIYMADIITQGLRPSIWIATAKTTLLRCLTYLLTQQYGSPTGTAGTADNPRYGGILAGLTYATNATVAAGVAFVKAAAALGDLTWLQAADRCAVFARHVQCGDLQATGYTVYPSGGGPYHLGGLDSGVTNSTGLLTGNYLTADIVGLWFLTALSAVRGPSSVYGDAAATTFFSAPTAAPLSRMISEIGTFASAGAKDSAFAGALVTGLSTTAPRATYVAATNGGGGTGTWTVASTIASDVIALATRGLYEAFGANAQVTAVLAWLASFTPNQANAVPKQPESKTIVGKTGTYDPSLAPADTLQASAPFTEATGASYSWASEGILSPMLVPYLRTSKDTLAEPQRSSVYDVSLQYLGPLGLSGLSLQPLGQPNAFLAAKAGGIFRQPPGIYPRVALF
jgi:hypothetical protein